MVSHMATHCLAAEHMATSLVYKATAQDKVMLMAAGELIAMRSIAVVLWFEIYGSKQSFWHLWFVDGFREVHKIGGGDACIGLKTLMDYHI